MAQVLRSVPLTFLSGTRASPRLAERVRAIAAAYREQRPVPPIPIVLTQRGAVVLRGEGNHRLAAARDAAVADVYVSIDRRDAERLDALLYR